MGHYLAKVSDTSHEKKTRLFTSFDN